MLKCRCLLGIAGIALALLVGACAGGVDPTTINPPTAEPTELPLAPGDKLRVIVYGEDKLSGDYQIDNGGAISLPLAGTIQGAGLTKSELEQEITNKLKSQYLRNPRVTVDVASFRPFYILGEVQKPGEYPFRSGLNVLSAIAIAGGGTYRASNTKVSIQRAGAKEAVEYPQSPTILVMPGDVVRVPERYF